MNSRKIIPLTTLVLLTMGAFLMWNLTTPISSDESFVAYKTSDALVLDGVADEAFWDKAELVMLNNYGTSGSKVGADIQMRFMHNGTHIFVNLRWSDPTQSDTRKGWENSTTTTTDYDNVGGNEDRITLAWSMGGAAIACGHAPDAGNTTMLFDVWHWKASRTAPAGWVDDKYWDGDGRHSDAKTAGGYSDNSVVAQAADAAEITTKLGNSTAITAFGDGDLPYWYANGTVIPWSAGAITGIAHADMETFVPGYYTTIPTGSRGDVLAAHQYNKVGWEVEEVRKLDTGNTDDIKFELGKSYDFYIAVHDNSGDAAHFRETTNKQTVTLSDLGEVAPEKTTVFTTVEDHHEETVTTTIEAAGLSFFVFNILAFSGILVVTFVSKRRR